MISGCREGSKSRLELVFVWCGVCDSGLVCVLYLRLLACLAVITCEQCSGNLVLGERSAWYNVFPRALHQLGSFRL